MRLLGIETSCDETSAAIVEDGRLVLSNVVSSQIALHAPYGGVVPEIASRHHVTAISRVVRRAIQESGTDEDSIAGVAVTYGPGLAGALLVGMNFARGLALGLDVPLIPVNHLEGHLHSVWLSHHPDTGAPPSLPMMTLIVSGGHSELVLVRDHGDYRVVGRTLDDAAGEAFDKVARLLGLPYPGGPAIQAAAVDADDPAMLPRAWLPGTYDFSFSGLKTAVLHLAYGLATGKRADEVRGQSLPRFDVADRLGHAQVANVAAGFQQSVVDVLVRKTLAAARDYGAQSIALVGGVAANQALGAQLREASSLPVQVSGLEFATDNAAMIAAAGFFVPRISSHVDIHPSLSLTSSDSPRAGRE